MYSNITINVKKDFGGIDPVKLFPLFEDGVRKRLPKLTAKRFYDLLILNINTNKYGFTLGDTWLKIKSRHGWDLRPFIAQGYYKRSISILSNEGHLSVGFKQTDIHPRSGKRFREIAEILEYGRLDLNIPARPLWRNTINEFILSLDKTVRADVQNIVNNLKVQ